MSLLAQVTTGKVKRPHYILMHGMPGLGKSTFASSAPKPIFLCAEKGTNHLDVTRLELDDFPAFLQAVYELQTTKHDYKTLVLDTVDHIEPLIFREVCKDKGKQSIEDIGYAKGYIFALDHWKKLVDGIERLREMGMNIVILAHTEIKRFDDPQQAAGYDRYQIKLHQKAAQLFVDRVEVVLFANYETFVKSDDGSKAKAFGDGQRVMYTEHRPAFQAKNRFDLPFKMSLDWNEFSSACEKPSTTAPNDLRAQIDEMLPQVPDAAIRTKIESYMKEVGTDSKKLTAVVNRLKTILAA